MLNQDKLINKTLFNSSVDEAEKLLFEEAKDELSIANQLIQPPAAWEHIADKLPNNVS